MKKTLFDKIWDSHVIKTIEGNINVIYIDRHYIHEVTSPQAFSELKKRKIPIFNNKKITATVDHNVPTVNQHLPIKDFLSKKQIETLKKNCEENDIKYYGLNSEYQGIVHVIGPELGLTLPGMTIVCGDSHTSTHGAFGTISFGIGTSQVAMVMATQCLLQYKPKKMRIHLYGKINKKIKVTAKDIILYIISKMGVNGGTGYFVEYTGEVFRKMSMEERMTICNMSIEFGCRGGIIAPDKITFNYIKNKKFSPKNKNFNKALKNWINLKTDEGSIFDSEHFFNASDIGHMITYGTNPGMSIRIFKKIPNPKNINSKYFEKSLKYMNFHTGEYMIGKSINYVFIGSCTNSRIEDLRLVAKIINGKKKSNNVKVIIVPGSKQVIKQVKTEGLDLIFKKSGFEFRQSGCSACLGMNDDKIPPYEYCVSTSNRNFEGRQGVNSRTILASPLVAAIIAIEGKIVNTELYIQNNYNNISL